MDKRVSLRQELMLLGLISLLDRMRTFCATVNTESVKAAQVHSIRPAPPSNFSTRTKDHVEEILKLADAIEESLQRDVEDCTANGIALNDLDQVFNAVKATVRQEGIGAYLAFLRTLHSFMLIPPSSSLPHSSDFSSRVWNTVENITRAATSFGPAFRQGVPLSSGSELVAPSFADLQPLLRERYENIPPMDASIKEMSDRLEAQRVELQLAKMLNASLQDRHAAAENEWRQRFSELNAQLAVAQANPASRGLPDPVVSPLRSNTGAVLSGMPLGPPLGASSVAPVFQLGPPKAEDSMSTNSSSNPAAPTG